MVGDQHIVAGVELEATQPDRGARDGTPRGHRLERLQPRPAADPQRHDRDPRPLEERTYIPHVGVDADAVELGKREHLSGWARADDVQRGFWDPFQDNRARPRRRTTRSRRGSGACAAPR